MNLVHLEAWHDSGFLSALDWQFAAAMQRLQPAWSAELVTLAALCSRQAARGHTLLDLRALRSSPSRVLGEGDGHPLCAWAAAAAWDEASLADQCGPMGPLVVADGCLFLRRHYDDEARIQHYLGARLVDRYPVDAASVATAVAVLFDAAAGTATDWQRVACLVSLEAAFSLITGGPGTGKTTTVVRLLALIQHIAMAQQGAPQRIGLAAPTGKAATRLAESIAKQVAGMDFTGLAPGVRAGLPSSADTLHRLLGLSSAQPRGRYADAAKLPLDWLIVDEASMIDLRLMARIVDSLGPDTRLVLLGDPDQLASVEAGAVLGQLTASSAPAAFEPAQCARLKALGAGPVEVAGVAPSGMGAVWTHLKVSHRFDHRSGIGALARAVNQGHGEHAWTLFEDFADIDLTPDMSVAVERCVQRTADMIEQSRDKRDPGWARASVDRLSEFQVLAAVRAGAGGVMAFNQAVEHALVARFGRSEIAQWYVGRPVIMTRNQPNLGVMNGDLGLCLPRAVDGVERLQVAMVADGVLRWFPLSAMQGVETVYAMTVHKSQGSEFAESALLWPRDRSGLLTRELIYTAITRARRRFQLVGADRTEFERACSRRVNRVGRLKG